MATTIYDCGDLAQVVISATPGAVSSNVVTVTSNGGSGPITIYKFADPFHTFCSGSFQIDYTAGQINTAMISLPLQGVWTDNFLMGLAGIICAALVAFVIAKYAI